MIHFLRFSYHRSVTGEKTASGEAGRRWRVHSCLRCGLMGRFPTMRHWSGHWRPGGHRCDSLVGHIFIGFPGLQSPQFFTNSSPSVLLPAPDLFYDSMFSLNPNYSRHCRGATPLLSCATKPKSRLLKQEVSTVTHSLLYTHTPFSYYHSTTWHNYKNQDSSVILNIWQVKEEHCFDSDRLLSIYVWSKWTGLNASGFESEIHHFSPEVFWVQNRQATYKSSYL